MIERRRFLELLALAGAAGACRGLVSPAQAADQGYGPGRFGNLSLFQIGDTHAQLAPTYYRQASANIGLGAEADQPPFLVGEHVLEHYRIIPNSLPAYLLSSLNFPGLAEIYGRSGGYAHLATVIKRLRESRPDSLLFDCGNSLQGTGPALWSRASDMVAATRLLGVDAMSGSAEFALGAERLREIFGHELHGRTAFLAQGGRDEAGLALPARPFAVYFLAGVPVGVIGQAFPPAGPTDGSPAPDDWQRGVDEARLQATVDAVRGKGARLVVLLSQAGLAADLKLASRVRGIDVVFSGRSHDPLPEPVEVSNPGGRTLVTSVGAYGKFVGVLDLDLHDGRLRDYRFRLVPVLAKLVPPDPEMDALIAKYRAPFARELDVKLADNEALLYRRGNFSSSTDQLLLNAMLAARDVEIAFTPGYRWGTTIMPGEPITVERLLEQTAQWDSGMRLEVLSGREIRQRLEGWLDAVFNPDPYLRSGDDMVRAGGLRYRCNPAAARGSRVGEVLVRGKPLIDSGKYPTASWGLAGTTEPENEPVWTVVADYLKQLGTVRPFAPSGPIIDGVDRNRGLFESA